MKIKNLNFDLFDVLNKVRVDKYGRVTAFLAIHKPVGITSHDVVDQVRKKLKTRKVGHVGALDPFASGVMLILVGKKYTTLSETLMELDKAYKMKILFGLSTDTLDFEGKITHRSDFEKLDKEKIKKKLEEFDGGYDQYVPVFSSVKVDGDKLRVLARKSEGFKFIDVDEKRYVRFFKAIADEKGVKQDILFALPHKEIKLWDIKYLSEGKVKPKDLEKVFEFRHHDKSGNEENKFFDDEGEYPFVEVELGCSKGTYVRQFAHDLGEKIDQAAMLVGLERTKVGEITSKDCIDIEDVKLPD